jgi:Fe-Mn family superoxide dismutase
MNDIRPLITLVERKSKHPKLVAKPLPYATDALEPVLSKAAVEYHVKLYKGYVTRFNLGEGDPDFNEAGAYMHDLYFPQFKSPTTANRPTGAIKDLIERKHGTFTKFRDAMIEAALKIQGSGWVYMSRSGDIKTIKNHAIRRDALLPIDMWEHSWALDYQADKKDFLDNIWRCIDWDVINHRLAGA